MIGVIGWIVVSLLIVASTVAAGEKGDRAALFADYDDLTTKSLTLLNEVRAARKDGYSSDPLPLLALQKAGLQLMVDARKFVRQQDVAAYQRQTEAFKQEMRNALRRGLPALPPDYPDRVKVLAITFASRALVSWMEIEVSYQGSVNKAPLQFLLDQEAHYEAAWKTADAVVRESGLAAGAK